ncbi:unnamed protein product [Ceutorhynchus assimilis]|uniref:Uncharacterized protein n=1 Tax=Ceutorhynchus assimilis TaxID=467358 RepID=A0A9N9M9Z5_9CUCU|nr:unnamed protein product [Ceutorhynchus assimilis]
MESKFELLNENNVLLKEKIISLNEKLAILETREKTSQLATPQIPTLVGSQADMTSLSADGLANSSATNSGKFDNPGGINYNNSKQKQNSHDPSRNADKNKNVANNNATQQIFTQRSVGVAIMEAQRQKLPKFKK